MGKPRGLRAQPVPDPEKTRTRRHGYGFFPGMGMGQSGISGGLWVKPDPGSTHGCGLSKVPKNHIKFQKTD